MADFASAFLACDQSTATDFELRLVGVRHSVRAVAFGRAGDRPPFQVISALSKLVRVWEPLQHWIVPRRPQIFDHAAKDQIQ
jgi:hypothetical protein